ncbi:MAG: hypothetical protein RLZZ436_479, partial [Planctomycetota bacterium]
HATTAPTCSWTTSSGGIGKPEDTGIQTTDPDKNGFVGRLRSCSGACDDSGGTEASQFARFIAVSPSQLRPPDTDSCQKVNARRLPPCGCALSQIFQNPAQLLQTSHHKYCGRTAEWPVQQHSETDLQENPGHVQNHARLVQSLKDTWHKLRNHPNPWWLVSIAGFCC